MSKFVVGVTGGIGAGKSAVTDLFIELGIVVVDADLVAREVVEPGSSTLQAIAVEFGDEILLADGNLNRPKMRELVFKDEAAKQKLNAIIHPAIRQEMLAQLAQANSPYVILSAPLLLENKLEKYVDSVLVVDVPESVQVTRASTRDDVDAEQIRAIMDSQCKRQFRLESANYVIDNTGKLEDLPKLVNELHQTFLQQAEA